MTNVPFPRTAPPAVPRRKPTRQFVIVVEQKLAGPLATAATGEVIVTACVEENPRNKVTWQSSERHEIGARLSVEIGPVVKAVGS